MNLLCILDGRYTPHSPVLSGLCYYYRLGCVENNYLQNQYCVYVYYNIYII